MAKGKGITVRDAQAVAKFGHELRLMHRLILEGHSRECAKARVFAEPPRTECACIEANDLRDKMSRGSDGR